MQLACEEPLFERLISLSGTFLARKPLSEKEHEEIYARAIKLLGLDSLDPRERIQALTSMEPSDIVKKTFPVIPMAPMLDRNICYEIPTFACLSEGISKKLSRGWCRDVMVGYCQFDVSRRRLPERPRLANNS